MPTKKRIVVPGAIAHIMARGIDGLVIFGEDSDRICFLNQLEAALAKTGYLCYAWALMDNHYHIVVRCSDQQFDRLMRTLNSRYARYFNRKYQRRGYLFQDRFKSIISQDQRYLEELIRYVHLNPLRAGICKNIEELDIYSWCGHRILLGNSENRFQAIEPVLRRFGSTKESARAAYRTFIQAGIESIGSEWIIDAVRRSNQGVDRKDKPECWVIGDRDFVVSVMEKYKKRLKARGALRKKWSIADVFEHIARRYKVNPEVLKKRSRSTSVSECRQRCAYLCCRVIGYSLEEVAEFMKISSPAVFWAAKKGGELIEIEDKDKFNYLTPG